MIFYIFLYIKKGAGAKKLPLRFEIKEEL